MRGSGSNPARAPRHTVALVAAAIVAVAVVVLAVVLLATSGRENAAPVSTTSPHPLINPSVPRPSGTAQGALTILPGEKLTAIPHSFLGLSSEYWTLPVDERHIALYRRILSLMHVPGDGPFVLRIGGDSSDHTFYDPTVLKLPRWVFGLTSEFVTRTAAVVRRMRLHVILDLNLITGTPRAAAAWARAAQKALPPGSIIGYEIGNEPDLYSRSFWLLATEGDRFGAKVLPKDITPANYVQDYATYQRVLARVAPGVPLYAPAVANPQADLDYVTTLLRSPHPGLNVVSGHRYPYSGCAFPGAPSYPTIGRILSENATWGMAQSVEPAVRAARRAGLPFRLTEINSITCGGLTDVSNAFATALWAPDAIFELERAGVLGVNLHARVTTINGPFTYDRRGLFVRPLLYGLILFARTLGEDAQLVPVHWQAAAPRHVKAWAVKVSGNTVHLLLINKGQRFVTLRLNLPATASASVERLLAPSPGARAGVTLGGQQLDQDGNWVGRPVRDTVVPRGHRYVVTVPAYSAALLSVPTPSGTLR